MQTAGYVEVCVGGCVCVLVKRGALMSHIKNEGKVILREKHLPGSQRTRVQRVRFKPCTDAVA